MTPGLVLAAGAPIGWELHCSMRGLGASKGDPVCVGCPPPRSGSNTAEPPGTPKNAETANFSQREGLCAPYVHPMCLCAPYPMGWSRMGWDEVGRDGDRDRIGMEYIRKGWDGKG